MWLDVAVVMWVAACCGFVLGQTLRWVFGVRRRGLTFYREK